MNSQANSPLTDSPWFWALAFSLMGLLALAVVGFSGKYQKRQAKIELQYQARERVAEKITAENNPVGSKRTDDLEARRPFATPGNNLITLWPLAVLLGIVAVVAATMLYRASRADPDTDSAVESP
jgi:hypothetical protein